MPKPPSIHVFKLGGFEAKALIPITPPKIYKLASKKRAHCTPLIVRKNRKASRTILMKGLSEKPCTAMV